MMLGLRKALWVPLVAGTLICFDHSAANAAVVINVVESGSDVIFSYTGQLDLQGLTLGVNLGYGPGGSINPSQGSFNPGNGSYDLYYGISSLLTPYGSGSYTSATSDTGSSKFGLADMMGPYLWVPQGYASNSSLSGGSTYSGSFSSLGLTEGVYTTNLPSSDTITMNIGAVPVPAPLPLLGLGAATAFSRKLKQRIALRRKQVVEGDRV